MAQKIIIDGVVISLDAILVVDSDNYCSNCPYPWPGQFNNNLTLKNLFIVTLTNSFVTNLTNR